PITSLTSHCGKHPRSITSSERASSVEGTVRPKILAVWALMTNSNFVDCRIGKPRGLKLYPFHAPEVEFIGKGKASAPYEFGVKASIVTTNARAPGGQFVLHAKSLPGNSPDGHTPGRHCRGHRTAHRL